MDEQLHTILLHGCNYLPYMRNVSQQNIAKQWYKGHTTRSSRSPVNMNSPAGNFTSEMGVVNKPMAKSRYNSMDNPRRYMYGLYFVKYALTKNMQEMRANPRVDIAFAPCSWGQIMGTNVKDLIEFSVVKCPCNISKQPFCRQEMKTIMVT